MARVHTKSFVLTFAALIILIAWLSLATVDLEAQSAATSGGGPWPAPVEATGQQLCYDPSALTTDVIPCAGTGQDGESQLGVAWPAQRFTDNLDGSVTDNLTGLIWLKDASCFQALRWDASLTLASNLASGQCSLTDGSQVGDWRMPNIKEILSLTDYSQAIPPLPPPHPFTGVLGSFYWTSTTVGTNTPRAWVGLGGGANSVFSVDKNQTQVFLWPMRGTTTGSAPVEQTGQQDCWDVDGLSIPCAGTTQDGETQLGVLLPTPRFTDHLDGTVTAWSSTSP